MRAALLALALCLPIPALAQAFSSSGTLGPSQILPLDFMARITLAEQTGIAQAALSNAQVLLFLLKLSGAQAVDVTDPLTIGGVQAMVSLGLLTQPRGVQILDLTQASP